MSYATLKSIQVGGGGGGYFIQQALVNISASSGWSMGVGFLSKDEW